MTTPSQIHTSLKSLLPSTGPTSTIPARLISAGESLLSLSRQRATTLKPDEEIARAHACAEIACQKLRAYLRLPNIKSGNGAPCRPAVYKRLVTFLEGVLGDVDLVGTPQKRKGGTGAGRTPRGTPVGGRSGGTGKKRSIEALMDGDEDEDVDVETPSKKRKSAGPTPSTTPSKLSARNNGFLGRIQASSTLKGKGKRSDADVPEYILPAVRKLCQAFDTSAMQTHVYTGVCVCIKLADPAPDNNTEGSQNLRMQHLCLTLAVFAVTLTRMHEGEMTQEMFDAVTARGLHVTGLDGFDGFDESLTKNEVEEWIGKITTWAADAASAAASWIDSVPLSTLAAFELVDDEQGVGVDGDEMIESDGYDEQDEITMLGTNRRRRQVLSRREEIRRELEKEDPDDVLLPGLGTMVNDAMDFTSAERVAEFQEWKVAALRKIDAIEKGGGVRKARAVAVTA